MEKDISLTQERKDQLVMRVKQCLDEGILNLYDWMKIYDILLEACNRDSIETMEAYLEQSITGEMTE